jgi:hypothetical protein
MKKKLLLLLVAICAFYYSSFAQNTSNDIITFDIGKDFVLDSLTNISPINEPVVLFICQVNSYLTADKYLKFVNEKYKSFKTKRSDRKLRIFVGFFNSESFNANVKPKIKINKYSNQIHKADITECLVYYNDVIDSNKLDHSFKRDAFKLDFFDKTDNLWFNVKQNASCPDDQASLIPIYFDFIEDLFYPKYTTDELLFQLKKQKR